MRVFLKKLSRINYLSFTALLIFSVSSSVVAQDGVDLVTDLNPVADCEDKTQIIPTCIFSRVASTNPAELITNDLKVCNCLKKNNTLFEQFVPSASDEDKVRAEKKRLWAEQSKKAGNLSVIQASSYSKDKPSQDVALLVYGGQESRQKQKKVKPVPIPGQPVDSKKAPLPQISTDLTTINRIDDKNKDWQCVTYQEYSVQRELPSDNAFFQILKNPTFTPADWNMTELKQKFDAAPAAQQDKIKIKMTFLSRNPIFQSIMKAVPSPKHTAAKILEKQTELFNILRTLSPSEASQCFEVPNGCFQEVHTNGAFESYTTKVGSYLMDKDVIDISSSQASNDYIAELERISNQGELLLNSVPTDPEGYFNYLQTANRELATSCAGESAQAACYTKFSEHCSQIRAIDTRVKKGIKLTSQDLMSGLREEESVHVILDPALNPSFRSFNDKICLQPFNNAQGESLNFFQYRALKCKATNTDLQECSDRKALLSRFLIEHNGGAEVSDLNLRTGFSRMLDDAKYLDVSLAQVVAANNISESPAELRTRFGNEFPTISPTGQLFAPVTSLAGKRPASTSGASQVRDVEETVTSSAGGSTSNSATANLGSGTGGGNKVYAEKQTLSGSSSFLPDVKLPDVPLPNRERTTTVPQYNNRKPIKQADQSETVASDTDDDFNITSENNSTVAPRPGSLDGKRSGSGSGIGFSAASLGTGSRVVAEESGNGTGAPDPVKNNSSSTKKKSSGKGLLFKYGLGENNQPEITLVSPTSSTEVKVGVDRNLLDRIKSNPNALEIGQEDFDKIMATPDAEVKLVLESVNGNESLVVYAKKDDTGGISFSLKPNRLPATTKKPVRISVLPALYDNIASDPDVYLNQNEALMNEIVSKPGSPPILQIVSPGKKALIYEVIKTDDYIYHFKLKNK